MKLLRMVFSLFALLLVVAAVAVLALAYFVDPNKLKPMIAEVVTKRTGYQLTMEGDLAWTVYPRIGVKVSRMLLSSPGSNTPFLDLRGVAIATTPSKLWQGQKKLEGDVNIDEVILMHLRAQKAHIELQWLNGELVLQPVRASLYNGTLDANIRGRNLQAVPTWRWDASLQNIQIKPLLQDANNGQNQMNISGIAQVRMQGTTQGLTREQLLKQLDATSGFSLSNGAVEGTDLNYMLRTADALLNKQPAPSPTESTNQTTFDSLTGSAVMKDGMANLNQIELVSPTFAAKGDGHINMLTQAINMQLAVTAQQALDTKWSIPLQVSGNLERPDVHLDTDEVQKLVAKMELDKVKLKVKNEIKEHIPGKTGEFLQNMLGR